MIEPTDEMKAAFRAAQERRAEELVAEGAPLGGHDILDRGLAAVLAIVERDYERPLREAVIELHGVLVDMVDPDPCHFDHHGYCQAHGWFQEAPRCPHARAKEVLS